MSMPDHTRASARSLNRKVAFYEMPGPTPRRFFFYRPSNEAPGAPLVVSVHGIARNAAAHAYKLIDEAERRGLSIVAPLFEKELYGQYQQLVDGGAGVRADLALLDILDAAARLSSASIDRILLFGFSGGAQFSQRFVLAHPNRVASAVLASAGWYTFPNPEWNYPYGLAPNGRVRPPPLDWTRALQTPQHVMVGELDVERDSSLRQSKRLDQEQGVNRLERAHRWVEAMREAVKGAGTGAPPTLLLLPGVAHSFLDAVEATFLIPEVFNRFDVDAQLTVLEG